MTYEPTPEFARRLDEADPLRSFRERFALPRGVRGEALVYLCGHSLGLMPLAARGVVMEELDDWAQLGVLGHEHAHRPWIPYDENLRHGLASLTGARPAEVVAMSSLTVNLHLLLAAFYRPSGERRRILIEAGAFSSDRHAVASQIAWHGLEVSDALIELSPPVGMDTIAEESIEAYLEEHGAEVALICGPECSTEPARPSMSAESRARRAVRAPWSGSISRTRSATYGSPCMTSTQTLPCGAATNT